MRSLPLPLLARLCQAMDQELLQADRQNRAAYAATQKGRKQVMKQLELNGDGYPTEATLQNIKSWPVEKAPELFDGLSKIWRYNNYVWKVGQSWHLATGGWSGNEEIIDALRENVAIWSLYWLSSNRGGRHVFDNINLTVFL